MYEFNVNDMTCGHCAGVVTKAVKAVDPAAKLEIDLATKKVRIQSEQPADELAEALNEAGYPATPV